MPPAAVPPDPPTSPLHGSPISPKDGVMLLHAAFCVHLALALGVTVAPSGDVVWAPARDADLGDVARIVTDPTSWAHAPQRHLARCQRFLLASPLLSDALPARTVPLLLGQGDEAPDRSMAATMKAARRLLAAADRPLTHVALALCAIERVAKDVQVPVAAFGTLLRPLILDVRAQLARAGMTTAEGLLGAVADEWNGAAGVALLGMIARAAAFERMDHRMERAAGNAAVREARVRAQKAEEERAIAQGALRASETRRAAAEREQLHLTASATAARQEAIEARTRRSAAATKLARTQERLTLCEQELAALRRATATTATPSLRRHPGDGRPPAEDADASSAVAASADRLAGQRVVVFTAQQRGGARAAFAERFATLGAGRTDVYEVTANGAHGPMQVDAGTLVVCDISFMGHTLNAAIRSRFRNASTCYVECSGGPGRIANQAVSAYQSWRGTPSAVTEA